MSKVIEILMNEHKEIVKFVGNLRLMCLDFINHNRRTDIISIYGRAFRGAC